MVQTVAKPTDQFLGPFYGLNTTMDESQLPQSFATQCRNIILSDGKIRIREPWRKWRKASSGTSPIDGKNILSMISLKNPNVDTGSQFSMMILHVQKGSIGELWRWIENKDPVLLTNQLGTKPSDFVLHRGYLYVLGGGSKTGINWMTDGTPENTHHAGMRSPTRALSANAPADYFALREPAEAASGIDATVQYAVTLLDTRSGREGNPTITPQFTCSSIQGVQFITITNSFEPPAYWNADKIRIYRKNISLGQVGYRFIKELNYPHPTNYQDDSTELNLDSSGVSTRADGPFAPSRNGYKSLNNANMGAMYKSRLFVNDQENDRIVRYSAIDEPWAMDPDDKFTLDGDTDEIIQGIAVLGRFLVIGKKRSMWTISGDIGGPTNKTIATGDIPLDDASEQHPIETSVGPAVESFGINNGNGFFKGGSPSRLYFPNDAGFFQFDGVTVTSLTDIIKPTWDSFYFLGNPILTPHFSFADDPQNGVIYIGNHHAGFGLAYHYRLSRGSGVPSWSIIDGGGVVEDGTAIVPTVFAPQSGFATFRGDNPTSYVPLMVGDTQGRVFEADPNDKEAPVPDFEWSSGMLPAIRGMKAHVYFARVFLTTQQQPIVDTPVMSFEVIPDGNEAKRTSLLRNVGDRDFVVLPVRRDMARIKLRIKKGSSWLVGWTAAIGILGWDFDTELVGQR